MSKMKPQVLNLKGYDKDAPFPLEGSGPDDLTFGGIEIVVVDRTSIWGNPFKITKAEDAMGDYARRKAVGKYLYWLLDQPELLRQLGTLKGKHLGCWCAPRPCHAQVLLTLANRCTWAKR